MNDTNLDNIVFALLFSADEPISVRKMSGLLEDFPAVEIKNSIEMWRARFDDEAWSVKVEKVAGGYQVASRPEYAPYIAKLYSGKRKLRLSKAALESLAVIAYKQPITRAEIENVRGVNCGGVISNLLERGLIKISGKAKVLGSPFLYNTTQEFLEYLGLDSLKDLPSIEELEALLEREEAARRESEEETTDAPRAREFGVPPEMAVEADREREEPVRAEEGDENEGERVMNPEDEEGLVENQASGGERVERNE